MTPYKPIAARMSAETANAPSRTTLNLRAASRPSNAAFAVRTVTGSSGSTCRTICCAVRIADHLEKTAREQTCTGEQHQRERDLCHDERIAYALLAPATRHTALTFRQL